MTRVFIGAGSNMGDRLSYLRFARDRLGNLLEDMAASPLYETAPRDYLEQDRFLNCVFSGCTERAPEDFLDALFALEKEAGRIRKGAIPKGPRVLDLDILLWGNETIRTERLSVPHPAMRERAFVLVPLTALDRELAEPETGTLYRAYLGRLEDQDVRPVDFSGGMW